MEIKKAEYDDLCLILELQKLCYRENAVRYNDYKIQPLVQTIKELEEEFNKGIILKAVNQSGIIGSIRAYQRDSICYIGKLIVNPDYQNKGIGKKLIAEIENRFPDVSKYELFTGFKDEKNIYLYAGSGYNIFKEENHGNSMKFLFLEKMRE